MDGGGQIRSYESWPEVLRVAAEAAGEAAALAFAREFGGTEIYVPAPDKIDARHRLARATGLAPARRIAAALGRGRTLVPMGTGGDNLARARVIEEALDQGASVTEAARRAQCHIRTVQRHKAARERGDTRQGRLDF